MTGDGVPNSGRNTFPSDIEEERALDLPAGWPRAFTSNGVRVVPGLHVRDYNWRTTTVSERAPHVSHGTAWFYTANGGMFDGSRLFAL